jgi:hypothetical protein
VAARTAWHRREIRHEASDGVKENAWEGGEERTRKTGEQNDELSQPMHEEKMT